VCAVDKYSAQSLPYVRVVVRKSGGRWNTEIYPVESIPIIDCIGRAAVGDPREPWTDGASDTGNGFQPILSWGSAAVALRTNRNTRGTTKGRRERTVRYNTRNTKAVQSQIDKPSMVYRRGVYHPLRLCDDVILKICSGHAYSLHEPMVIMARMPTGE